MSTLVRHPALAATFLPFSTYLQKDSTLPERIREFVILRTSFHHGCAYEWAHHNAMARQVGLTDSDVEAARSGSAADEFDQAVLDAVDELHSGSRISAAVWERLGQQLDDRQRMDLIFTFGGYSTLAFALNTFDVQPEEGAGSEEFYATQGS